jgi:probable addiction module antidote protein
MKVNSIKAGSRRKASIPHSEALKKELRADPKFAVEYIRAALEEEHGTEVLLLVLRQVAEAYGIARVAKAAGIQRESLYRALSAKGNPKVSTLAAVAGAMGLRINVEAA